MPSIIINTPDDLRAFCLVDKNGHWTLKEGSAIKSSRSLIFTYNYSTKKVAAMNPARASWSVFYRKPLKGHLVIYSNCKQKGCLNPEHLTTRSRMYKKKEDVWSMLYKAFAPLPESD